MRESSGAAAGGGGQRVALVMYDFAAETEGELAVTAGEQVSVSSVVILCLAHVNRQDFELKASLANGESAILSCLCDC